MIRERKYSFKDVKEILCLYIDYEYIDNRYLKYKSNLINDKEEAGTLKEALSTLRKRLSQYKEIFPEEFKRAKEIFGRLEKELQNN